MEKSGEISFKNLEGNNIKETLFTYSEDEKQENQNNAELAKLVFSPEFIPFYPEIRKKYDLSLAETLLYGFIRFFLKNCKTNKFYFSDDQLGQIFDCSGDSISAYVAELKKKNIIDTSHRIKGGGGTNRYIRLLENYESEKTTSPTPQKTTGPTPRKLGGNYNMINKNKLNDNTLSKERENAPTFGNENINKTTIYFTEHLKSPLDGSLKENRQYCHLLLTKLHKCYPTDDQVLLACQIIDFALADKFHAQNATSFKYLYYNLQKIILSNKLKSNSFTDLRAK